MRNTSVHVFILTYQLSSILGQSITTEKCHYEIFEPECKDVEVLIIQKSVYGFIKTGRCRVDEEHLGCQNDATQILCNKCCGKRECREQITASLHADDPEACSAYWSGNAEIEYLCLPEMCNAEDFEPDCTINGLIIIDSAFYGYMRNGRCINGDNNLGCKNDIKHYLSSKCSGRKSCVERITNNFHVNEPGACGSYFAGYADISYSCLSVAAINPEMCGDTGMALYQKNTVLSSVMMREQCRHNAKLKLNVDVGQRMNVSITEFSGQNNMPLGSIRERQYGNVVYPKTGVRNQHVLTSVGNSVEIDFASARDDIAYLYEVSILGCGDMTPPEGAWITRDDDVIEIGCHSGSKSWSLQCVDNQWVGVMGHCGVDPELNQESQELIIDESTYSVSLNVIAFGVCSLVILLSACIFLAGTIILKKKMKPIVKGGDPATMRLYSYPNDTLDMTTSQLVVYDQAKPAFATMAT